MTNDEKTKLIYGIVKDLRRVISTEVLPPQIEQDLSNALVYLDCAKNNLMNEETIFKVVPTVVKKS